MAELLEAVASWPSLVLIVVVFGFAPGFCLRLIVLAYPRSDPRRKELVAELYTVPRFQRPLWVAEQLEVALFEGFAHRVSAAIRWLTYRRRSSAEKPAISLIVQALSQLPDLDRAVVRLYYFENLTLAEISQTLGLTESRVRQLHTRLPNEIKRLEIKRLEARRGHDPGAGHRDRRGAHRGS